MTFVRGLNNIWNLRTDITWQLDQMFPSIISIQGNNIISVTKAMTETHVTYNAIRIILVVIRKIPSDSITQRNQCQI